MTKKIDKLRMRFADFTFGYKENQFAEIFPTVTMTKKENVDSIAEAMINQINNCVVEEQKVNITRSVIEQEYSISCWVRNILEQYEVE